MTSRDTYLVENGENKRRRMKGEQATTTTKEQERNRLERRLEYNLGWRAQTTGL